ncbi:MAG: hypothetical protein HWE08_14545 [Alphaproteobacteria bacterium]|nr:hypothetical protein [Alphaproteobacteria bacterium]
MRRVFTICAAVTALASGAAVLQLKLAVQEKAERVEALAQQIHEDQEALRVLEAEWAFLTTPRSLQEKSIRFLALMPPSAEQVVSDISRIPFRPRGVEAQEDPGVLLPAHEREEEEKPVQKDKEKKGQSL